MFKDILKVQQPIVYKILLNALTTNKLAHAYLFEGSNGTPLMETAQLFAQSLICSETEGYACEECETCKRLIDGNYADLQIIDGSTVSIKKKDIIKLQEQFTKTGIESYNKRIYIIKGIDNATPDALNSLLKFLEEPGVDVFALLLSNNVERVIPTIISRCQVIHFKVLAFEDNYRLCKTKVDNKLDAYLGSYLVASLEHINELYEGEEYQHARYLFIEVINALSKSFNNAMLFMELEAFSGKTKRNDKQVFHYFLDMLILLSEDSLRQSSELDDPWWSTSCKLMLNIFDLPELLKLCLDSNDKLLRSINLNLLMESFFYQMKEVMINERK
ncbi:MAG: DNA polymerase III subunit delta [Erysipelotrichaceae bacterium]